MENAKKILFETRPTAVNLGWGLNKIMEVANNGNTVEEIRKNVIDYAKKWQNKMYKSIWLWAKMVQNYLIIMTL